MVQSSERKRKDRRLAPDKSGRLNYPSSRSNSLLSQANNR